jgi:hypothetical protein
MFADRTRVYVTVSKLCACKRIILEKFILKQKSKNGGLMKKTIVDKCSEHWTRDFFLRATPLLFSPICDFLGMSRFEPKALRRATNLDTPSPFVN